MAYDGCFRCRGLALPEIEAALALKAAGAHTHAEADVTGLTGDLAAKAAVSHTHADGTMIQKVTVKRASITIGSQTTLNFIAGNGIALTIVNNTAAGRIDITISSSAAP